MRSQREYTVYSRATATAVAAFFLRIPIRRFLLIRDVCVASPLILIMRPVHAMSCKSCFFVRSYELIIKMCGFSLLLLLRWKTTKTAKRTQSDEFINKLPNNENSELMRFGGSHFVALNVEAPAKWKKCVTTRWVANDRILSPHAHVCGWLKLNENDEIGRRMQWQNGIGRNNRTMSGHSTLCV